MSDPAPIRVLIADDDVLARRALTEYLAAATDIDVLAVCTNGQEAVDWAAEHDVDVVILDVKMPVLDGVAAARTLSATRPRAKIVMLTSFDEDEAVMAAVAAGASGFLLKTTTADALTEAVRAAHRGITVMAAAPVKRWSERRVQTATRHAPALNERERSVLAALCQGMSNAEIAAHLYLSESSVKNYISTLMQKLDASTRIKVVLRAFELGLDQPPAPQ